MVRSSTGKRYRFVKRKWIFFFTVLDTIGRLLCWWKKHQSIPKDVRKVLVIKLNNIGDTLPMIAVGEQARKLWPGVQVDVLVRPTTAGLFSATPLRVITLNPFEECRAQERQPSYNELWQMVRAIRRERYDIIMDLRGDIRNSLLASFCGSFLIGYADGGGGFLQQRSLWGHPDDNCVSRDVRLLSLVCDYTMPALSQVLTFPFERCATVGLPDSFVAVHALAGHKSRWLTHHDINHVITTRKLGDMPVVFVGAPSDKELLTQLSKQVANSHVYITDSIQHLASVLCRAAAMICSNSGPMHVAGFLKVPLIMVSHDTDQAHDRFWCPYLQY